MTRTIRRLLLLAIAGAAVVPGAYAAYGGFRLDELVANSDTIVLARRKGPETTVSKQPLRYRVLLEVKEVWKGRKVPRQVLAEYELDEGVPQVEAFGTSRDFVAFLARTPRQTNSLPVYEFRLGNDAALLVPSPGDLCAARNIVAAPMGIRGEGVRYLDLRWVRKRVERLVQETGEKNVEEKSTGRIANEQQKDAGTRD